MLLKIEGHSAEEIRNTTQQWVLTKPIVSILGKSYQLDPYCSVVVHKIGDISCDVISPPQLEPDSNSDAGSGTNAGIVAGILLLVVIMGTIIIIISIVIWRRSKKAIYNIR